MTSQRASVDTIASAVRGVSSIRQTERGLTFSRLPEWTYAQHAHAPVVAKMAERLSGAHLALETTATRITFTYRSLRDEDSLSGW